MQRKKRFTAGDLVGLFQINFTGSETTLFLSAEVLFFLLNFLLNGLEGEWPGHFQSRGALEQGTQDAESTNPAPFPQ